MEEKSGLKVFLVNIWPKIYRLINSFLYFLLTVIRAIVKIALNQLKGGGV